MNAIQFIKEHGVEKAREVVEGAPELAEYYSTIDGEYYRIEINAVNLKQLKRLVESVDLIKFYNGIEKANFLLEMSNRPSLRPPHPSEVKLKQAIADYELIYSDNNMGDCEILDYPEDYTSPNCKKFDERVK